MQKGAENFLRNTDALQQVIQDHLTDLKSLSTKPQEHRT